MLGRFGGFIMADRRGISGKALGRIDNPLGTPVFVLHKNITGEAADVTLNVAVNVDFSFRIIDVWAVANADMTASETLTVKSTSGDVTDAFAIGGGSTEDTDIFRAGEIDDANMKVSKNDDVTVYVDYNTVTVEADLYILCVRV
tara:strand:+ start:1409 stop:1840 length:432 start_codon:yes stop_codon:yes gene_type:complete